MTKAQNRIYYNDAPLKEKAERRVNFLEDQRRARMLVAKIRKDKQRNGIARNNVPIVEDASVKSSTKAKPFKYAEFWQQLEVKADSVVQAVAMDVLNNPEIRDDVAVKIVYDLLTLYKDSKDDAPRDSDACIEFQQD